MTGAWTEILQRYASRGVLVDTNVLLLYFVGRFRRARITSFKRTRQFTENDFDLLDYILSFFNRVVTTPNILAEVSNLSGQLGEPERSEYFRNFAQEITLLDERWVESATASKHQDFSTLGLTDCAILHLAKGNFLVLTADRDLYSFAVRTGVDAINFNHLSESGPA